MISWALTFLIIAIISGVLGFSMVAGVAATIAKVLFAISLLLFITFLVLGYTIFKKVVK